MSVLILSEIKHMCRETHKSLKINHICLFVCESVRVPWQGVKAKGQLVRVVLPSCGSRELNSDHQAWLKASLIAKPSHLAGKRINPEREPQDCLKPVFTEIGREEPPRLSVLPRRENLTLLRVPGRVQWDLPCLPLPFLCVPCRYDVDSKSPDLSKHVSSACDCPASLGSLKCRSLTGPWTSLKEHVSRTARREGGGVAVNMVADAGLFCPGMQDFLGQAFCTLGEIVGSSGSRLEKPLT